MESTLKNIILAKELGSNCHKFCRDCGHEMFPFDVHTLNWSFIGWVCIFCGRAIWKKRKKDGGKS